MQHEAGVSRYQRRPFRLGLLHAILAKRALAGGDDRRNGVGTKGLGHRNQRHRSTVAAKLLAGARDLLLHGGEAAW